ncbi:MAG: hypothetical protein ABI591_21190 [Kofleriaceae bacterium]
MTPKDDGKGGKFPPDPDYAVPTGSPDVYDPSYVPPPADPAHGDAKAADVPPAELYPPSDSSVAEPDRPEQSYSSEWDGYPAGEPSPEMSAPYAAEDYPAAPPPSGMAYSVGDAASDAAYVPPPSDAAYAPPPPPDPDDAPILPVDATAALQHAVGAPSARARKRAATQPRRDGDGEVIDDGTLKRSKRTMLIATASIVGGLVIATLVFLGHANSQRYELDCSAAHAVAMQGRSFPPWGVHALNGPEWAPIALPANAECQPKQTEDVAELGKWYLELLIDRATVTLTAKDILDAAPAAAGQPAVSPLDTVSAQLDQALLLARDPDKRDQRKEITRLQGDVLYWHAAARLRDASAVLLDASKQFDAANAQHPRHATDAAAWSTFLHHLADELRAGPNGAPIVVGPAGPSTATEPGVPVPVGTALPVEAGSGAGSAEAPAPPDAGVPSGGVLL